MLLRNPFTKALWDSRRAILGWGMGIGYVAVMYTAFYPSLSKPAFATALQNYPEALKKALGMQDIVSPAGYLESVVERDDIAEGQAPDAAAAPLGRLAGRTVPAGASLADVRQAMTAAGRRRVAVTSADGRLLGLLCLKASRTGFCSDQDVRARTLGEADPAAVGSTAIN